MDRGSSGHAAGIGADAMALTDRGGLQPSQGDPMGHERNLRPLARRWIALPSTAAHTAHAASKKAVLFRDLSALGGSRWFF